MKKLLAAVAVYALLLAPALADSTINNLGAGTALSGTEQIPMFQASNPATTTTPNAIKTLTESSPTFTGTSIFSGSPTTITFIPSSTGQGTVGTGGTGGPVVVNMASTDYSAWTGGPTFRPFYFGATLAPSVNTSNLWTQFSNYTIFAGPGQANAEINNFLANFTMNSGQTSTSSIENYEARFDNSGTMSLFSHYLVVPNNTATGTITAVNGLRVSLTNANTTAGAITTFAAVDMETMGGGGSQPTNYYFLRNNDANAVSATLGHFSVGNLGPPAASAVYIQGPDTSGSTAALQIRDSTGTQQLFFVNDDGTARFSKANPLTLGTVGSFTGRLAFANGTSGSIEIRPPATGALGSAIATLPINTGTIAEINFAQSWTANQTMSAALFITAGFTVATLPAGTTGARAHVTDATSCTFGGTLTGSGSTYCPVTYNGSAWVGG